jgi:hypothetical protein
MMPSSSKAAVPLVLQQQTVVLQQPASSDGSSGNSTLITAKKVHRRRPRKSPIDMPIPPEGDAPASLEQQQQAGGPDSTDADAGGH